MSTPARGGPTQPTPPPHGGPAQPTPPPGPPRPSAPPRRGPGRWVALGCAGLLGLALLCGLLAAVGAALGRGRAATPTAAANAAPARTAVLPQATPGTPGPPRQAAQAATAATPEVLAASGCGGGAVRLGADAQLRRDLGQWNRVVAAANPVTEAWNRLLGVTHGIAAYREAAGNTQLIAAADDYLAAAGAHLPALRAEAATGRFAPLAAQEVAAVEASARWATLLRTAAAESDQGAWNGAIDVSREVEAAKAALDAEVEAQCAFWRASR